MKRILALAALIWPPWPRSPITAPAGATDAAPKATAAAVTVKLKDSFFSPSRLTSPAARTVASSGPASSRTT